MSVSYSDECRFDAYQKLLIFLNFFYFFSYITIMRSKYENEKENLTDLIINQKLSYEEVGNRYQCTGSNIKKVAQRLGLELSKRRKINETETFGKGTGKQVFCLNCGKNISHKYKNIYCDNYCQTKYLAKQKYEYFLTSPEEFQRSNYNSGVVKRFILKEQNNKCVICGQDSEWKGKRLVMILDHIDGNASNNTRENFRCICPNCDSQLDTYKSKNKNSTRSYYRYKYNGFDTQEKGNDPIT